MNKQWLFTAGVAEIISGRKAPPAQAFLWDFVKIYHEIIALLRHTPEGRQLTGYQWAGRMKHKLPRTISTVFFAARYPV